MPKTLWTPDRDVLIDKSSRTVKAILPAEMKIIESMHVVAQRHNIVLACVHCRQPFQGLNSGHASIEAISCGCRELRAVVRPDRKIVV